LFSRDPEFVTPAIKASLRRKNRLLRAGRIEEANALAARIGKEIVIRSKTRLCKVDGKMDSKGMWAVVRELISAVAAVPWQLRAKTDCSAVSLYAF